MPYGTSVPAGPSPLLLALKLFLSREGSERVYTPVGGDTRCEHLPVAFAVRADPSFLKSRRKQQSCCTLSAQNRFFSSSEKNLGNSYR